ncbi:helix-turn-helix domain-containing protein [Actinomadura sp. 21ATH]|uniref:helix-turn-helix domain-containing protein n=1 Tax=Actinomadura sp. 21ATH TaxID=1735444 RepID=UPI0035C06EFE
MPNPERAPTRLHHEPEAVTWAREKAGLSQAQLARECGFTRSLICEIEAGTRNATPATLMKIAEALNCPVVFLERKRQAAS